MFLEAEFYRDYKTKIFYRYVRKENNMYLFRRCRKSFVDCMFSLWEPLLKLTEDEINVTFEEKLVGISLYHKRMTPISFRRLEDMPL